MNWQPTETAPEHKLSRDEIARAFLYEVGVFDTPAEIEANPEHHLVKAAYRAADRLHARLERMK